MASMTFEDAPDPYLLAEAIVAGEEVNGWSIAARMLAAALVQSRTDASPEAVALQRLRTLAEAVNERVSDVGGGRFVFADGSRDAIEAFRLELFNREETHD